MSKLPVAPVTTDLTDPKAEPETEEPAAPVPPAPQFPFLRLNVHPANLKAGPDDSAGGLSLVFCISVYL